jgi:hypothetical protein
MRTDLVSGQKKTVFYDGTDHEALLRNSPFSRAECCSAVEAKNQSRSELDGKAF